MVVADIDAGRLARVLGLDPPFSGYHLSHPSRRQTTPALAILVEACVIAAQ